MGISCKVLDDSICRGHRLTTLMAVLPRFMLAELNTHRQLGKSSASSRAVPVHKRIKAVEEDPFIPFAFGKNKGGMQSGEVLDDREQMLARAAWDKGRRAELEVARELEALGVHKQHANRRLEADSWHTAIITGTEWSNYFALRRHPAAQPEFQEFANTCWDAMQSSTPEERLDRWHLPLVRGIDLEEAIADIEAGRVGVDFPIDPWELLAWISVGRCARVSYLTHEGKRDLQADVDMGTKKLAPVGHMAPLEHACRPMDDFEYNTFKQAKWEWNLSQRKWTWDGKTFNHFLGNVQGWVQLRKLIPNEHDFGLLTNTQS